jgi:hypothetical protein
MGVGIPAEAGLSVSSYDMRLTGNTQTALCRKARYPDELLVVREGRASNEN